MIGIDVIAKEGLARPTARKKPFLSTEHMVLPALIVLALVFFIPLVSFFIGSLSSIGSGGAILREIGAVVTAPAVIRATLFTLAIASIVTVTCLVAAYPLAYALLSSRGIAFSLIMACIVLPYFVSTIVRTYAWMVLLGRSGVVNQLLFQAGLTSKPLQLMYNETAIIIGMVYVLLPYMVLTLYASMKSIDGRLLRAAASMGASGPYTFRRVFLPLTVPGIVSGSLIIFILSLGFFVTPALMGGPRNVTIAMLIEREVEINLNWPLASIVSLLLLAVTMVLYAVYYRFARIDKMFG